jgi:putative membrane protein
MNEETQIKTAEFNPKVRTYWLLSGALVLTCTVVGIPLLLLWFPLGLMLTQRHLDRMSCVLTDKALKVGKGILVRTEKTIPLDKITDMGMVQGPIMRRLDLHTLTVETAGQSSEGSLVSLTGIVDARLFREAVLAQREALSSGSASITSEAVTRTPSDSNEVLLEIRDALLRIETRMQQTDEKGARTSRLTQHPKSVPPRTAYVVLDVINFA